MHIQLYSYIFRAYIIFYLLLLLCRLLVYYCTILIENELEWQQKIAPFTIIIEKIKYIFFGYFLLFFTNLCVYILLYEMAVYNKVNTAVIYYCLNITSQKKNYKHHVKPINKKTTKVFLKLCRKIPV